MISKDMVTRWPTREEIAALHVMSDVDILARRIARKGNIGRVYAWLRVVRERHLARRAKKTPVPSVREWLAAEREAKYAATMYNFGPIPRKRGAGGLYETVVLGRELGCRAWTEDGDQRSVASSYYWTVLDHYVEWSIPRTWEVRLLDGEVVAVPRLAYAAGEHKHRPLPCAIAVKSRGYSGRWVDAYICGNLIYRASSAERAWRQHTQEACAAA